MEKVFTSPFRYVQEKDVLKTGLSHILALGDRLLLLCDPIVYDLVGKELEENLMKVARFSIVKSSMVKRPMTAALLKL